MSSPCARCPRVLGSSCCEVKGEEQLATLTWADVDRISAATGRGVSAFTEFEWLGEAEAMRWSQLHAAWGGYFGPATRRLTLKRKNGACVFHAAATGCTLTAEQRPTACRLYPFEVRPHGEWGLQAMNPDPAAQFGAHATRDSCGIQR